jgi:L-fuconate dehydratase
MAVISEIEAVDIQFPTSGEFDGSDAMNVPNQVMFKQPPQAGAVDVVQIDASRVAGVTENVAILLLAAKYGGPGLCAAPGDVRLRGGQPDHRGARMIEYVDHLHERSVDR